MRHSCFTDGKNKFFRPVHCTSKALFNYLFVYLQAIALEESPSEYMLCTLQRGQAQDTACRLQV